MKTADWLVSLLDVDQATFVWFGLFVFLLVVKLFQWKAKIKLMKSTINAHCLVFLFIVHYKFNIYPQICTVTLPKTAISTSIFSWKGCTCMRVSATMIQEISFYIVLHTSIISTNLHERRIIKVFIDGFKRRRAKSFWGKNVQQAEQNSQTERM